MKKLRKVTVESVNVFEENIRAIVVDELEKRESKVLQPVRKFCEEQGITRVSIWRAEKAGEIKLTRIGKKIFINPNQFSI